MLMKCIRQLIISFGIIHNVDQSNAGYLAVQYFSHSIPIELSVSVCQTVSNTFAVLLTIVIWSDSTIFFPASQCQFATYNSLCCRFSFSLFRPRSNSLMLANFHLSLMISCSYAFSIRKIAHQKCIRQPLTNAKFYKQANIQRKCFSYY